MRPDPEMMLACDCQGSLGIGLEVAQGTFAVVGSRQKALAARCRFELIVRRRVLEFRKWICRGHRNSRAPAYSAPVFKEPNAASRKPKACRGVATIAIGHVCFTPESGHVQCTGSCLLRAKSGHS